MPGTGKISQVIGSTFDAEFPEDQLPAIYNAVKIEGKQDGMTIKLTGEVASHLGGGKVRAVALGSTDGLRRGMDVTDTGGPVAVPVGKETLGRVFNLLGEPIDNRGPITAGGGTRPIHREPMMFCGSPNGMRLPWWYQSGFFRRSFTRNTPVGVLESAPTAIGNRSPGCLAQNAW